LTLVVSTLFDVRTSPVPSSTLPGGQVFLSTSPFLSTCRDTVLIVPMTDKPKNVFRIDIEPSDEHPDRHPTHGWQVRIKRQKKQHTKYFSDKRFGGREEALEKAVAYRDELLETLPDPMDPVRRSAEARSKTGVIGLNFCWKDDGSGTPKPYVQLSWLEEDGTRRSAAYSVRKWNLRRAVWKACVRLHKAREEHNGEVDEVNDMFQTAYPNIQDQYDAGPDGDGATPEAEKEPAHAGA
jgi:hypothetical protein